jgi:hypothetical protein
MQFGAPAKFNEHGTRQQFLEYRDYGNHMSLTSNLTAFQQAMNKEDKQNYILTFPAYLKDYIPDLWLTPNGLIQIPSKKDRPIFDALFLLHAYSWVYNNLVAMTMNQPSYLGTLGPISFAVSTTFASLTRIRKFI